MWQGPVRFPLGEGVSGCRVHDSGRIVENNKLRLFRKRQVLNTLHLAGVGGWGGGSMMNMHLLAWHGCLSFIQVISDHGSQAAAKALKQTQVGF